MSAPTTTLVDLGTALSRAGRHAEAREVLLRAVEDERHPLRRARLLAMVAGGHRACRETDEALRVLDGVLAELGAAAADLSAQVARRERELAERLRLAFAAMPAKDPELVLQRLLVSSQHLFGAGAGWLLRPAERRDTMLLRTAGETATDGAGTAVPWPLDEVTAGLLRTPESVTGLGTDRAAPPLASSAFPRGSWLAAPLARGGTTAGLLLLAAAAPGAFRDAQVQTAGLLVAHGMAAFTNAELLARLQDLAVVDELTGIANRRRFFELAERDLHDAVLRDREVFALMIDIDRFTAVNDAYGRWVGDEVVREVAARLMAAVRPGDLLGRYGGAKFCLQLSGGQGANLVPERLRAAVQEWPVPTTADPLPVTVSVGVTSRTPADPDVAALLARADRGLHQAKENGRNRVEWT